MTKSRVLIGLTTILLAFSGEGTTTAAASAPAKHAQAAVAESACVPNQWTQVHRYVNPFWVANYRYQVNPGVSVNWRWFSGGVPPYWEGRFTTTGDIWTPPSWYTSVEFMCSSASRVLITPL